MQQGTRWDNQSDEHGELGAGLIPTSLPCSCQALVLPKPRPAHFECCFSHLSAGGREWVKSKPVLNAK